MKKGLEKKVVCGIEVTIDPSINDLPIPKAVQEKVARAKANLAKHPIPDYILKGAK